MNGPSVRMPKKVHFRVTEQMYQKLYNESKRLDMKVSEYLRWMIRKELGYVYGEE